MNFENQLLEFIMPSLLWLIPVLWTFGYIAKKSEKVEDWGIPLVLLLISVPVCTSFVIITKGFTALGTWMGVAQSLAIWAMAVATHATYRQAIHKRT